MFASFTQSTDPKVSPISIEILPVEQAEQLENFADHFSAGWLDADNGILHFQFQLVTIFKSTKVDNILLSGTDHAENISLTPTNVKSPGMGERYPEISWSGQSRFVFNETINLPMWAKGLTKFDLLANVKDKLELICVIHVLELGKEIREPGLPALNSEKVSYSLVAHRTGESLFDLDMDSNSKSSKLMKFLREVTKKTNRVFLVTVLIPTLISGIYFGLLASDIYISESRFVVRSPQRQPTTTLGALFQGAGFSRSQDDSYTVQDYIFSRDALLKLDEQFSLGKKFSDSDIDIFSRFAGLGWDDSFEALYRYYLKRVSVNLDSLSSITTLSVNAFSPDDALQLNEKLLELSENLVNQLNERGRQDMIRFALAEVETAEKKAKSAALAVSNYRNKKGVFDPEKQSALQLQQVSKMQDELIASKIQLSQILAQTSDNPQIPSLKNRIETLQTEIDSEVAKVAGGNRSLANKSSEYEGLILERVFSEKQLAAALTSLEQARNDAQRKQLYLERIAQPSRPDVAMEPRRIRNVLATFVVGMLAWGILTMLMAGVREHQD